jgi:DNA-binding MarR family transcriptional regulator
MTSELSQYGISLPEWALLGVLMVHPNLRQSDIAAELGVKPPVASALLKTLEAAGLIVRETLGHDTRVSVISLSDEGHAKVVAVERKLRVRLRSYLKGIKISELITYVRVLTKLADRL